MTQVARRIQELETGEAVSAAREKEKGQPRLKLRITSAPLPSNQSDVSKHTHTLPFHLGDTRSPSLVVV